MRIVVYGAATPGYKNIVSKVRYRLAAIHQPFELVEENRLEVFLEKSIGAVPAVQLNEGPIESLGHNGQAIQSIEKWLNKMIMKNEKPYKVIVPIDFSSVSEKALTFAYYLARTIDAQVEVIHIYMPTAQDLNAKGILGEDMLDLHEKKLHSFVDRLLESKSTKINIKRTLKIGFPVKEILAQIDNEDNNLLVMGTNGKSDDLWYKLGSVTLSIMNKANCPVVVVPKEGIFSPFEHILFAFEDTVQDVVLLEELFDFAALFRSNIHFVHVEKTDGYKDGERLLEFASVHYPKERLKLAVVVGNDVAEGLNNYALQNNISCVVMPSSNRSFVSGLFRASVRSRMALMSKVPIMILK